MFERKRPKVKLLPLLSRKRSVNSLKLESFLPLLAIAVNSGYDRGDRKRSKIIVVVKIASSV